jgi:phage shock protein PspC (stress-responsive transcriptional regulator)
MGSYFGCDSTLMRVGWVLAAFLSGGLAILAYLVLILVVPNEPYPSQQFHEPVRA